MAWYDYTGAGFLYNTAAKAFDYAVRSKEEETAQKIAEQKANQRLDAFQQSARDNAGRDPVPSVGYHPNTQRMRIASEEGGDFLVCHYDPTEFVEKYTADWHKTEIVGSAVTPIQFQFVRPREWSMKLLFNDLGEDVFKRTPDLKSVESSLFTLRGWFLPRGVAASTAQGNRPPVLNVIIVNEVFKCCLTDMSVVYKAVHPTSRVPTRAEVSVVFTEFTPGNIPL